MTSFIIPSLFIVAFIIWMWQSRIIPQESAVFRYKLLHRWRRFLSALQPTGVDQLEEGVVVLDGAYRVVDVNGVAEKLLGQTAVALLGCSITTIYPTLAGKFEQTTQFEVVQQGTASTYMYELCLKPLVNWQKKPYGHILIITDVTERKSLERMRRDMTATLVHDLRAPLSNSIFALQMLEIQLNAQATPEVTGLIRMMIGNTEKILARVNGILEVERLDSQQMPLVFSAVSLPDVLADVLATQASRIADKELDIATYVPDSLAAVWADAGLLERVVQNLVDNSIKFTPVGGEIVIAVTAVPQSDRPTALISISDSGTGIPESLQKTIFEKFTGTTEKGSSGLGLAFCKMALAAHGQDIWVESEPGRGSIFTFSLALATRPHYHPSQPTPS